MYGTCETLCRALAAQYTENTPLMLVVWSPEEIQALADGMEISLTDHEIRTVLARLEDIPEDQRSLPYRQLRKVTGQADRGIPRSLPYRQLRKPATTD